MKLEKLNKRVFTIETSGIRNDRNIELDRKSKMTERNRTR